MAASAPRLRKTVVLVGMMGAGKTAVGTALARRLGVPFTDQDDEIEAAANASIAELFRDYGEAFFREKEGQVLARLLKAPPGVLSTGGGAFLSAANRARIDAAGVAVWLDADLDLLWARVRHKKTRPLLRTERPYETLRDLLAARRPIYAQARLRVEAARGLGVEAMADQVLSALAGEPDILTGVPERAGRGAGG